MIGNSKVFHNEEELKAGINEKSRQAMQKTLERMLDKLGDFIYEDVYMDYFPSWYDRTYYLSEHYREIFETYYWNNFGKGVGGAIRINDTNFESYPTNFIHGSGNWRTGDVYSALNLNSYLEIMNNPNVINPNNPFHFPSNRAMGKGQFWEDFKKWADENFTEIFKEEFVNAN